MSFLEKNFDTKNDDRFNFLDSRKILRRNRSLIGYSQPINSGTQALISGVRAQIFNDAQGAETISTENLWNPINNRINLQDAEVNDYIDVDIILTAPPIGVIFQVPLQLDFSPDLDGSQVISAPVTRTAIIFTVSPVSLHYSFKFIVTQQMKDNGIGIMVTPFGNYVLQNTRFTIERLKAPT